MTVRLISNRSDISKALKKIRATHRAHGIPVPANGKGGWTIWGADISPEFDRLGMNFWEKDGYLGIVLGWEDARDGGMEFNLDTSRNTAARLVSIDGDTWLLHTGQTSRARPRPEWDGEVEIEGRLYFKLASVSDPELARKVFQFHLSRERMKPEDRLKDRPSWFNPDPNYFSGVRVAMEVTAARLDVSPESGHVAFGGLGHQIPNYQMTYGRRSFLFLGSNHNPWRMTSSQFTESQFDPSNLGAGRWSYDDICRYADEDMPESDSSEQDLRDYLMGLTLPGSVEQDPQGAKRRMEEYRRQSRDRVFTARLFEQQDKPNHCAVCDMDIIECLQGAHVVEVKDGGQDIVTNGIVLCGSHHLMFDKHLFGICPETREVVPAKNYNYDRMRITCKQIKEPTGTKALSSRWDRFQEARKA